jgi:hypothetical protein
MGQLPSVGGAAGSPSAITNIPTVNPTGPTMVPAAGPVPMSRGRESSPRVPPVLPAAMPPPPPPSAPQPPPADLAALSGRTSSGPGLPKLTAAAPMLTNGKEDNSTQLVDGDTLFNPGNPAGPVPEDTGDGESATVAMQSPFRGKPPIGSATAEHQLPTDPARHAVAPMPEGTPVDPIEPVSDLTLPPSNLAKVTVVEPPRANAALRARPGRATPASQLPRVEDDGPSTDSGVAPPPAETSQQRRRRTTQQSSHRLAPVQPAAPEPVAVAPSGGSNKVLFALIGVAVLLLAVAVTALFVLKPAPTGLLLIDVPPDSEVIDVSVNGETLREKDGSPIKSWPHLHQVRAGEVGVLIKVKGFDPLIDKVVVKEGGDVTRLTQQFKKKAP